MIFVQTFEKIFLKGGKPVFLDRNGGKKTCFWTKFGPLKKHNQYLIPTLPSYFQTVALNTCFWPYNAHWSLIFQFIIFNFSYIVGKFRIGHLDTVGKLLAFLGLYKETADMMASNMAAMEDRHFRSSRLLSYSANVAFVLYTCTSGGGPKRTFKVQVLVDENKIALPVCANEFLCDYEVVRQAYSKLVNSCNEKQFCSLHSEPIVS